METNNFQKLMQEEEENYQRLQEDRVHSKVWGTLSLFRLVGDLVDVFVPRVVDVFVMVAGGRGESEKDGRPVPPRPPSQGDVVDPGKIAPGSPEDIRT